MSGFDDCAGLAAAADNLLARSAELKMLRKLNPGEARKVAAQIEVFEKRFRGFLTLTEGVPKLRQEAEVTIRQFARGRERFGIGNGGQVEITETKLAKFLADTEEIPGQREAAEEALLKFASARSLLNGEAGN
jgi:hypothetical protein